MKSLINLLVGLAILSLSLSVQASISLPLKDGSTVELYDKSYALLIGVADYEYWPDLPGVEEDIAIVEKQLKKHGFKVISLLNPTRSSFDNTMRDFIGDYGQDPENRLIVYYAGHGYTLTTNRGRELGYIVPTDAPLPSGGAGAFKKKAISMLEVEIFAKQMESKHALFTFDSCFSGSLFEISRAVPDTISLKTSEPVRQFITAGSADQTVPDKSVFRRQFVSGLEGDADINRDGFITGTELAQYIGDSVTNYTRRAQTPQYGKIRDPYLDKGDFVFINPKMEINITVPGKETPRNIAPQQIDPAVIELSYWDAIKGGNDPVVFQAYLDEYPEGRFNKLATLLIQQAEKKKDARLKVLSEKQEKSQAKDTQKIASISKDYYPQQKPINSMSIAILTWPGNLQDNHHFDKKISNKKFGKKIANTIAISLDKKLGSKNNYIKISNKGKANLIRYENDNADESKRACIVHKANKIVMTYFTRSSYNGSAEIHIYDCDKNEKVVELVDLDTTRGEDYYLEKSLEKELRIIYEQNPKILSPPS